MRGRQWEDNRDMSDGPADDEEATTASCSGLQSPQESAGAEGREASDKIQTKTKM